MKNELILTNGKKIPVLAYGTWLIKNDDASECVKNALKVGYRHIDTAQAYGNESGVGKGIKESGLSRDEIYVTTKVKAEFKTYKEAKESIDASLKRLGLDYVDLILIHCPQPWREFRGEKRYFKENIEVWKALEEAYEEGKTKAIGVSNFLEDDLGNIFSNCKVRPMVNQVLCHIGNTPLDLIEFCRKNDVIFESYSPIAHGAVIGNKDVEKFAEKYGVTVAQLCIKYTLQLDTVSIPKAKSFEHIKENFKLDFEISKEDMEVLKQMKHIKEWN